MNPKQITLFKKNFAVIYLFFKQFIDIFNREFQKNLDCLISSIAVVESEALIFLNSEREWYGKLYEWRTPAWDS